MAQIDANGQVVTAWGQPVAGAQKYHYVNGATFTLQTIKAAPGTLFGLNVVNGAGAAAYVQLFDALAANVTPGTTAPIAEYEVASGADFSVQVGAEGIAFANGICVFSATAQAGGTGSAAGVAIDADYQ